LKLCPVRHRLAISSADKHNCTPAHFLVRPTAVRLTDYPAASY